MRWRRALAGATFILSGLAVLVVVLGMATGASPGWWSLLPVAALLGSAYAISRIDQAVGVAGGGQRAKASIWPVVFVFSGLIFLFTQMGPAPFEARLPWMLASGAVMSLAGAMIAKRERQH